ncbi:50S ribosomal protein L4 [Buchnera aphidicola (Cinara tujafilina)]|uniref:Large ribosomal subunit protein uL4 n=1 Tax=Buchnera aphidicola (Cinara tujafilina) TaxID=261317 RepID=F7WZV5_9GAMM|nr:50S ribosomal protein L4 [Buchnera aphidicola]AEH39916.1 50S ribosomal protein L4 [Buchnera aphidicola (Cinara tujafilina)]
MEIEIQDSEEMLTLSDIVFGKSLNEPLIHQVVTSYLSSRRKGSKSQKSRSEVSGSGKKPWRQKGTGRARAGSLRSPIWRSGGVTFAAKPKNYKQKINKKMYQGAIKSIFSELIRQNRVLIFNKFNIDSPKTKSLLNQLNIFKINNALIITHYINKNLSLAAKNLYYIDVINISQINPIKLITYQNIVVTIKAIKNIEEVFI